MIKLHAVFVSEGRTGRFAVGNTTVHRTDVTVLGTRNAVFIHLSLFWDGDSAVHKGFC